MTSPADTVVILSRLQFAITTLFHILWPVLTIGLSLFLVVTESLWMRTGDIDWYHHSRFWGRLFLLNFSVGVVTGVPLEFEFGTNWANFSTISRRILRQHSGLRRRNGLHAGGRLSRHHGVRLAARAAGDAPDRDGDGRIRGIDVGLLDSGRQFLDADARRAAIWRTAASWSTAISTRSSTPTCLGGSRTCGSPVSKPACS